MEKLRVQVLTPYAGEDARVVEALAELDIDADVRAATTGSTTHMILTSVVVTAPISAFLGGVLAKAGDDAYSALKRLVKKIATHDRVELEDRSSRTTIELDLALPDIAYRRLFEIDIPEFDRDDPAWTIAWNTKHQRWVASRAPWSRQTTSRQIIGETLDDVGPSEELRELAADERERLYRLANGKSAISGLRAAIVFDASARRHTADIARRVFISPERVRSIIREFNADGFEALVGRYRAASLRELSPQEEMEVESISLSSPRDLGLDHDSWTIGKLADFLVADGILEDTSHLQVKALLQEKAISLKR
jgi:hypothetical protein